MFDKLVVVLAAMIPVILLAFGYALSWIVTCGLVKLVTMCFGWSFSWPIATGIWLILCIAKAIFGKK